MAFLKSVLREELNNSLRIKARYEQELKELPVGALRQKKIGKNQYYYLVHREGKKVIYEYKGNLCAEEVAKYQAAKKFRAKYRNLLSVAKKQVRFLKGVLRGKEPI